ncbi:MOSC domain-containing protein [Alteromonas oceanisediminis]|uniref:MOSC domain-containing protein n=1 Tax=Alteromonas oceanisediminis TaxID=2836180 RepID=UPI001BDA7BBD|nr:MOSC domain-containing protein [Alteromonas oceanisediminis]MBT0586918.1 MOSC domain-containing protein [Alteromonas oceanisediminis]
MKKYCGFFLPRYHEYITRSGQQSDAQHEKVSMYNINQLFAGTPKPFGAKGAPSSIHKQPVQQLTVFKNGTLEDEQGNKKLHGGPEKVLHQYAISSYQVFQQHFAEHSAQFVPGSIGENISAQDMNDKSVCIGDVYRVGSTLIQVGSPRVPCSKISQRFGLPQLDRFVNDQGICGWYFRVLEEGKIDTGDTMVLESRETTTLNIADFMALVNDRNAHRDDLLHAAAIPSLDPEWQIRLMQKSRTARAS